MDTLQLDQLSEQILFYLTVSGIPSNQMTQISVWDLNCSSTEDMYFWFDDRLNLFEQPVRALLEQMIG